MDFRKKEWEEKPVVLDKPRRGREMVTTDVPKDLLDTMRMMTTKQQLKGKEGKDVKTALEIEREGDVEMYHEGWVDGKRYLVPDSNLEIMKDLVNMKIRRKGDSVFVQNKDYEASKLDTKQTFQRRLRALSGKINELEKAKLLKKKSEYKNSKPTSTTESTASSLERRKPFEIVPMSEESTNFLISGHIRENSSPLYIIQKYKGKSPFGKRRSDFSQVKSARNVDIRIRGHFFRKSVLEEGLHSIEGIRLQWNFLIPVDERSKLYEKSFSEHFFIKGVDILFEGDFIKHRGLLNYTPILTFLVPRPQSSRRRKKGWNIFKPQSMFSQKNLTTYNVQIENEPRSLTSRPKIDDFTNKENSSIEISSIEVLDGKWSSTEGLDKEFSKAEETSTEFKSSGYESDIDKDVNNETGSYKMHLVVVPSRNGKGSVAGGSSSIKLPESMSNATVSDEKCPNMTSKGLKNHNANAEETVVVYAARNELLSPYCGCGDEPCLRSSSSHSIFDKLTCDQERSDQGDAGHDIWSPEYKREERPHNNRSRGIFQLKPKNCNLSDDKLLQKTFDKKEFTKKSTINNYEIPEYRCQVRPNKRRSRGNCLMRNISKLFSRDLL